MKTLEIYTKRITLECACVDISQEQWDKLMKGAVKANGKKIRQMIKIQLPDLYADLNL
jgi:hypothetical protein